MTLFGWKPGRLAQNTFVVTTGMVLRALSQGIVFISVARNLGAHDYGAFVSLLALASTAALISSMGGNLLLVRDLSRYPDTFAESWGMALVTLGCGILLSFPLYLFAVYLFLPAGIPYAAILFLGIGEVIIMPLANLAMYAYQGHERMGRFTLMMLAPIIARMLAALLLWLWVTTQTTTWSLLSFWSALYLLAALIAAVWVHICIRRDYGSPILPKTGILWQRIREGVHFSVWGIADKLYMDADKVMLARLSTLEVAGLYSAGYRLVDLISLPLQGLLNSALPRYFRAGEKGADSAFRYATQIATLPLLYALAGTGIVFMAASFLPFILGSDYQKAVSTARWLAWLPLLSFPRLLMQHALLTSGQQKMVMTIVMKIGLLNVALNLWWIPFWSWQGAVMATYVSELVLSVYIFWVAVRFRTRMNA